MTMGVSPDVVNEIPLGDASKEARTSAAGLAVSYPTEVSLTISGQVALEGRVQALPDTTEMFRGIE